jgi:hypothetical protein
MPEAKQKKALKDSSLKALKPAKPGTRENVWDSLMPNLVVRITDKGRRTFYAVRRRFPTDRNPTWARLGIYPQMSLGEAREAAR